jgi:hypothetical protein
MDDEARRKKLNDALKTIAEFAEGLPEGWDIKLTVNCEESSIELEDPRGDYVEVYDDWDCWLWSAMEEAKGVELWTTRHCGR